MDKYKEYLDFAINIAKKAGAILMQRKGATKIKVQKNMRFDFATNVDLEVEKLIIDAIFKKYPKHGILSEETEETKTNSPFRWVIDPLDGTWNYSKNYPYFGTIIALEHNKEIVVAVYYMPQTNELFYASKSRGFYLNNNKMVCTTTSDLNASFVFSNYVSFKTLPDRFKRKMLLSEKLVKATYKYYPSHQTSMDLVRIAQGVFDATIVIDSSGKWWDRVAGFLFIKEAGGKITSLNGGEVNSENHAIGLVASNGKIHKQLLEIVNSV